MTRCKKSLTQSVIKVYGSFVLDARPDLTLLPAGASLLGGLVLVDLLIGGLLIGARCGPPS